MTMAMGATPGDENRPENTAYCPLPTIFTINAHGAGRRPRGWK